MAPLIRRQFAQSYDESLVRDYARRLAHETTIPGVVPLGSGRHFTTFGIRRSGFLSLALGIIHRFEVDANAPHWENWIHLVNMVGRQDWPLVPPMRSFLLNNGSVAYVMPEIPEVLSVAEDHRELTMQKRQLLELLSGHNLRIDDHWHIQKLQGSPFVIDWSDLVNQ